MLAAHHRARRSEHIVGALTLSTVHHVIVRSGIRKPPTNRIAISDLVHGHLVAIWVLVVREAADCIVAGLHADIASKVDLLLARHSPTCTLLHHWRLDDTHPVGVRVQVLPCVIHVLSILAIKTLVCSEVRVQRSNVRSAVGSLSAYGLSMTMVNVSATHGGRVHSCEHRLVGAAATIVRDWGWVVH